MIDSPLGPPTPQTAATAPRVANRGPDPVTVTLWVAGALVTLLLPWFVPLRHRLVSSSYNVGFDNQVAMLGSATTALLLGLYRLRQGPGKDPNPGLPLAELRIRADRATMRTLAPWALLLAVAYCGVLGAWHLWIPNNTAFEMGNALSRIELLLLRQVPYRDFQFNYGPLFLYLPVAIVEISHHLVGPGTAYFCSLLIFACLGLALLFYVVAAFALPRRVATTIFVLMALASFNFLLGMNYTLVRFALPYAG
ncbi:MAG TPA: hypothetical protein VHY20_06940, partial [Pirellulales bacterium]|nr:hypothetical protein [Pirellulales bacterium]